MGVSLRLRRLDTPHSFSAMFTRDITFVTSVLLFCFPAHHAPSKKKSTLEEKAMLPQELDYCPSEYIPVQKGAKQF